MLSEATQTETIPTVVVLDSDSKRPSILQTLREVFQYRYLLQNLIIRDLKVRYKNSVLGILWSLLNPLMMMAVYTFLFTILIPNEDIHTFPMFILVALVPWTFFSGAVIGGTVSIVTNAPIIKKVYFPRILLPISVVFSNMVNFGLAFIVLVILLTVFGLPLTIHALWVPLILLTQVIFLLGICFFLATLQVFLRDTLMILEVILLAWFFLTPVFYPLERYGPPTEILGLTFEPAVVMRWINPMASIIDSYRTVLWGTLNSQGPGSMDLIFFSRTFITAVIVFLIGFSFFTRWEHLFGEKL
ncbi:MAG: ABC transporter permease [Chloroflexota bacterium]